MKNKSLIDYVNEYCENNEALNDVYRGYIYGFLAAATDHQEYQELDNPFIKLCIFEKVNTFIKKLQYAEKGIITIEIMGYIDKILDMACK